MKFIEVSQAVGKSVGDGPINWEERPALVNVDNIDIVRDLISKDVNVIPDGSMREIIMKSGEKLPVIDTTKQIKIKIRLALPSADRYR